MNEYLDFLKAKMDIAPDAGFDISLDKINPRLKPHQAAAVQWALRRRLRA
jgi:hypothetical protein